MRIALVVLLLYGMAVAQTCRSGAELSYETREAVEDQGRRFFLLVADGRAREILSHATPMLVKDSAALEELVARLRPELQNATASPRNVYMLETAQDAAPIPLSRFYCGAVNMPDAVGLQLADLQPGTYALVVLDVSTADSPYYLTFLLRQDGKEWLVAGLYPHRRHLDGHDTQWFWQQAREFAGRGQPLNAWLHYTLARETAMPVRFMTTQLLEAFLEEMEQARPSALPGAQPLEVATREGERFLITEISATPDPRGRGLIVAFRYSVSETGETTAALLRNKQAMLALAGRFPELRQAFTRIIARAVTPSGEEFGSVLAMADLQ